MYFIYGCLLTLGFLLFLPRFLFDAFRHGKYVAGFRERLGFLPKIERNGRPVVWLHCVSVGETQAARSLTQALRKRYPHHRLVVSTVTIAGQNLAREVFGKEAARVFYFPFDWRWSVRRALNMLAPAAILIMETELWPGFLRECQARAIPVAIVNGRLSDKSFRRYKLVRRFMARVLDCVRLAVMQTEADAGRLRSLGFLPDRVFVSGSLKYDSATITEEPSVTQEFRIRYLSSDSVPLVLAASTHAPEERIILAAFQRLRAQAEFAKARLLIAPRHPERFAEVASLLQESAFSWSRRSDQPSERDASCDTILLDSIGELRSVYKLASIVFVGGSIAPTGGHNILEPAAVGACVVTGPHTENFKEIVRTFVDAGVVVQLPPLSEIESAEALQKAWAELLSDPAHRKALGAGARALVEKNRGATKRTVDILAQILDNRAVDGQSIVVHEGAQFA